MKKMLLLLLLPFCFSCKKEKCVQPSDKLVFGQFYGECAGEHCIEIYKIENGKLYEDRNDQYPGSTDFYPGNYDALSAAKYDAVKNLQDVFPAALLNDNRKVIGTPDGGDWGGYYIEYQKGNVHRFWLIDKMRGNIPIDYRAFMDSVESKIVLLK